MRNFQSYIKINVFFQACCSQKFMNLNEMKIILFVSVRPFKNTPNCTNMFTNSEDLIFENFGLTAQDES